MTTHRRLLAAALATASLLAAGPGVAVAAVATSAPAGTTAEGGHAANGLEAAAARAGDTGRAVAMSLIGLALAVAATALAFRRDFKEAAGVFVVGIVAVLLATPAGLTLLRDTVTSVFGSQ